MSMRLFGSAVSLPAIAALRARVQGRILHVRMPLVAVMVLCAACASGPVFAPHPQPSSHQALIYIFRPASMGGALASFEIFANDEHVTTLSNGGYFPILVRPGPVVLSMRRGVTAGSLVVMGAMTFHRPQRQRAQLETLPGEVYFVKFYISGMTEESIVFELTPENEAMPVIEKCRLVPGGY